MSARDITLLEIRSGYSPFEHWYTKLKDKVARRKVLSSIIRLANPAYRGFKSVGEGVFELRIFYGPGYRVYFSMSGETLVILLAGGDKDSQKEDIKYAKEIWKRYKNETKKTIRKFIS